MTRAKICGLTRPADRDAAVEAGAHALGFIVDVDVDTPREITPGEAADLIADVPPFVTTVLVTMPDSPDGAAALLERTGADAIQVHGGFAPDDVSALADLTGARVITAVDATDPDGARRYDRVADALLVDSVDAAGGGGTGRTHDWEATRALRDSLETPVILAGGLAPDNVAGAVRTVDPFAVDVASGVERKGGVKDHDAVAAFVAAATRGTEVAPR